MFLIVGYNYRFVSKIDLIKVDLLPSRHSLSLGNSLPLRFILLTLYFTLFLLFLQFHEMSCERYLMTSAVAVKMRMMMVTGMKMKTSTSWIQRMTWWVILMRSLTSLMGEEMRTTGTTR